MGLRKARKARRAALKANTEKFEKEYEEEQKHLVSMRRQAKSLGQFFVEPEAKLIFCMRISGINKLSPKPRKILQLLRLRQLHNGVFLKVNRPIINMLRYVAPYVTFGYPNLKSVKELIYKRGFGKVNKCRIPITDNDIVQSALGSSDINGWRTWCTRSSLSARTSRPRTTSSGRSSSTRRVAASCRSVTGITSLSAAAIGVIGTRRSMSSSAACAEPRMDADPPST